MHGSRAFLVNAEVDSMDGVVEGGVGIGTIASPQQVLIEKVQAELRQEFDVREERRRELEFLEKGGDLLYFKLRNVVSISVQSTSHTDQHPEQFVNSEAKGSFALTASPHGDSLESSGRPGVPPVCEPISADNLMLFDGENQTLEGEKNSLHRSRTKTAASKQSFPLVTNKNAKELGGVAAFSLPKKAYRRRNRSRQNRDGARSSSTDVIPSHGGVSSSTACHDPTDAEPGLSIVDNQKEQKNSSNLKNTGSSDSTPSKNLPSDSQLYGAQALESRSGLTKGDLQNFISNSYASKNAQDNQHGRLQLDAQGTPNQMASEGPESAAGREQVGLDGLESSPCITMEVNNKATTGQMNGFSGEKGDRKGLQSDDQIPQALSTTKGLDSESSCTQNSHSLDGNNDNETCTDIKKLNMNGNAKESALVCEGTQNELGDLLVNEENETKADDSFAFLNDKSRSAYQSDLETGSVKGNEGSSNHGPGLQEEKKDPIANGGMEPDGLTVLETDRKLNNLSCHSSSQNNSAFKFELQSSVDPSVPQNLEATLSVKVPTSALQQGVCSDIHKKIANKQDEESILEEAQIVEAKQKRITELSVGISSVENCRKSHWEFVIEEMMWLANDFSQERVWKITTAAQLSHRVALTCRLRFEKQNYCRKQREVGHTLGKAVMEFWHSAEEKSKELELHFPGKDAVLGVHGYSIRFLKQNGSHVLHGQVEAPVTPDRTSDLGILDMSFEDNLAEENLFYTVPLGSMEMYRKSIEFHLTQCEKTGSSMQEEVETSAYDGVIEFGSHDNTYDEDEGETSIYYFPGAFEGGRSSKFAQKKHKNLNKAYGARSYEMGVDLPFVQCMENKVGTQKSVSLGKRPSGSLNVSIPTKRVRTASRQRVLCPSAGTSGCILVPGKTDASSSDTSSFQDEHITLHGGSQILNGLEVESSGEFEKQLPFNSGEVSKPKKKKKEKHLVSAYGQRWQLESNFQIEQRDHSKKRSENHQLESNRSSGLFGKHVMKKPKLMRQSLDNSFDNIAPMSGSVPSPVASQMSNMSNSSKFIRMFGGGDQGRKGKSLKVPAGQTGSGWPWSIFEDQALVVLVHDMGPNWELVSDAICGTLPFKCIFRKPKECKERHKILMDRSASDGADSAEDSGSSQPYPSTLPGIPKGSARQLFQRLQGPMEEDTLKSHFEKIIMLWQKHHYRQAQNNNKDPKQLQQPHNSHKLALSQVSPNNLNGGPILTPLDLCDTTSSSPDVPHLGYQGPYTRGLAVNQGSVAPMLPGSCANSPVQRSNMIIGSNFSIPVAPLCASTSDGRYGVPRTASLSIEERQRMQHYNQMLSGRNTQYSSLSVSGAFPGNDCVQMLPRDNGMDIMGVVNRSMPTARPGFQGVASSPMLNSGSMLSSGMVALPSPVNMHPGVGATQGSSIIRPRDALQMTRNQEPERQMLVSELPMQGSQGNNQAVPPFAGLTSSLTNQTKSPPIPSYPLHQQQPRPISPHRSHLLGNVHHSHLQGPNHVASTQHQEYAVRVSKERQRILQQQFTASNALMPPVQPPSQLPLPPTQPNSQIQSQTSSPVSLAPSTPSTIPLFQHQQKHQMPPHGLGQNAQAVGGGLNNQMGKQRQHQPQQQQFQQPGRQHSQQRQQSQSQRQAKLLKGSVRGNMMMNHNLPMDSSLNCLSANPGSQSAEKNEQVMHLVQGQGLNPVQQSSSLLLPNSSNQALPQQKMYSGQVPPSSNQLQQMLPHPSENGNQGVSPFASGSLLPSSHQAVPPQVVASSNQQPMQAKAQQTSVNHGQATVKRMVHQILQVNSDLPSKLQAEDSQAGKHAANNSSQISTTKTQPQTCIDVKNAVPAVSSPCHRWKELQPLNDSITPNSAAHLGSTGTAPLKNPTAIEAAPPVSHGLDQIQSSGCLSPIEYKIGAKWQQQSSQLSQPSTPLTSHKQLQQQRQSPQHQFPPQQSQQQAQLLTQASSDVFVRPTNSRLE